MAVWELWMQKGKAAIQYGFHTADRRAQNLQGFDPEGPQPELVWTVEADAYLQAMALYHEYMGWEPYRPKEGLDYGEVDRALGL